MTAAATRILPLPADVIAQIKSSTAITSLTGAVLDLVRNSLDADARRVDITVDFPRGACTVEDDGQGILPAEFGEDGGLGKLHNTSKYNDARPMYGRNGAFLSSLAAVSLVSITSRHSSHRSYCTINLHRSRVITRLVPAPSHQQLSVREHGTRVTVRDLFGNMPVRVKYRAVAFQGHEEDNKQWINLKKSVVALLLAWGRPLTVTAKDRDGNSKFVIRGPLEESFEQESSTSTASSHSFKVSSVRSILSQATYISPFDWRSWVVTSARTITITVRGVFSLQPAPSKHVQFISIGIRPVHVEGVGNELYDSINRIFASSSFGILKDEPEIDASGKDGRAKGRYVGSNGPTNKRLKRGRKDVDRWPMFYVQVDTHTSGRSSSTVKDDIIANEQSLKTIIDVLSEMVIQFLKGHRFRLGRKSLKKMAETTRRGSISSTSSRPSSSSLEAALRTPVRAGNTNAMTIPRSATGSKFKPLSPPTKPCAGATDNANYYDCRSERHDNSKADHIRIPSFSKPQSNDNDNMFSNLSRIKAGKGDMAEDVCAGLPTTKVCKRPMQSSSVSHTECVLERTEVKKLPINTTLEAQGHAATGCNEGVSRETSHLSPCTIQVGALEESVPQSSTEAPSPAAQVDERCDAADEVLIWTNPISKATLAINGRTGIVVPQRTDREIFPPSAAGLSRTSGSFRSPWRRSSASLQTQKVSKKLPEADSWVGKFLETWHNPVFRQTEEAIPHVQMCEITGQAALPSHSPHPHCLQNATIPMFEHQTRFSGKLSKDALKDAEIIAQVDDKFVLIKMEAESTSYGLEGSPYIDGRLLVLVDQHAADERCRIEELMAGLCRPPALESKVSCNAVYMSSIITTPLSKEITFPVSIQESDLFRVHAGHFADWGILYDVVNCRKTPGRKELEKEHRVVIKSLPPAIFERCKTEPAHLISLLRGEVWGENGKRRCGGSIPARQSSHANVPAETSNSTKAGSSEPEERGWLQRIGDCPQGILDLLNSRACRSAIMFNDQLSREQCQTLISKLAQCAFPFQCAHGRPSMVPLVDLGGSSGEQLRLTAFGAFGEYPTRGEAEQPTFVQAFRRWKNM